VNKFSEPALLLLLVGLVCAATLYQVGSMPTWPMNHELDSFFKRTEIYALHISQGDYFPIYSSSDNLGYGSAQPALYHKLFYVVSGWLHFFGLALKPAVMGSIWLFMVLGSLGVYRLCRLLECSPVIALIGALMLPLANYTVTNWLVRGAVAEFAGAMVVPWVLVYFLESFERQRLRIPLAVAMAVLFLAHSVLAYFLGAMLLIVAAVLVLGRVAGPGVLKARSLAWPAAAFVAITGPYLAAMHVLSKDYDISRIIPPKYQPENQVKDFKLYFWDKDDGFGRAWDAYTVQLDWPVLALLLAGVIGLAWHRRQSLTAGVVGLACLVLLALALQTGWAVPLYGFMPGALYLQFPWRLLAVMTPALIALALALAMRGLPRPPLAAALALACMFMVSGAFVKIEYALLPPIDSDLSKLVFSSFREYIPTAQAGGDLPKPSDVYSQAGTQGCVIHEKDAMPESLMRSFEASCTRPATVPVPIFSSALHFVETSKRRTACGSIAPYAALCAIALPEGKSEFGVRSPTFGSMLAPLTRSAASGSGRSRSLPP
jgi:hypothetical protein